MSGEGGGPIFLINVGPSRERRRKEYEAMSREGSWRCVRSIQLGPTNRRLGIDPETYPASRHVSEAARPVGASQLPKAKSMASSPSSPPPAPPPDFEISRQSRIFAAVWPPAVCVLLGLGFSASGLRIHRRAGLFAAVQEGDRSRWAEDAGRSGRPGRGRSPVDCVEGTWLARFFVFLAFVVCSMGRDFRVQT